MVFSLMDDASTDRQRRGTRALVVALLCLLCALGCRAKTNPHVLRLGYFANVTHAPAVTGVASGRFARALGDVRLETHLFNAGPAAVEALLAGAVDVTYVGPGPAVAGFVGTRGRGLRVIAGATSGGALFVVRTAAGIHGPGDLHGKRLGTPQLGNTQDLALRRYLAGHGLTPRERGGDVDLVPMDNASILTQFRMGNLDGAWVPEPWGSRLVAEAGGIVFVDERDLWPGRRFATTVLAARPAYVRDAPGVIAALRRANEAEIAWIAAHPTEARDTVQRALAALQGARVPDAIVVRAWARMDFTADPMLPSLAASARSALQLGMLTHDDVSGILAP